jgi:hypothetical protein
MPVVRTDAVGFIYSSVPDRTTIAPWLLTWLRLLAAIIGCRPVLFNDERGMTGWSHISRDVVPRAYFGPIHRHGVLIGVQFHLFSGRVFDIDVCAIQG